MKSTIIKFIFNKTVTTTQSIWNQMFFSDNGPGVRDDDKDYIFEPFFSGKGSEGRGLGLYIIRSILNNNDYSIYLADIRQERKLSGANFVVSFVKDEENGY